MGVVVLARAIVLCQVGRRRLARHADFAARDADHRGVARGQACVLREAAVARSRGMRCGARRACVSSASAGDDRLGAAFRCELWRCVRTHRNECDRQVVHGAFADLRQERPGRFLRAVRADVGQPVSSIAACTISISRAGCSAIRNRSGCMRAPRSRFTKACARATTSTMVGRGRVRRRPARGVLMHRTRCRTDTTRRPG